MNLIFSFDTEDFVTPEAADAQKWWADELHARSVRGTFQVVAEVVRAHRRNGREDVIAALSRHEIGYHSDKHSVPPVPPVALEGVSLAEGIPWVLRKEAAGWATVIETFGRAPISYCSPGDSWTPHTLLAFASAGCKVFCGGMIWGEISPCWYAGLLCLDYDMAFDTFMGEGPDEEARFKETFTSLAAKKGKEGVMVVYSHPTRLVTTRFWDTPYFGGAAPEKIGPAPLRTPRHIQTLKDRFRALLDWMTALPDIRLTDMSGAYAKRSTGRRDLAALLDECGLKPGEEGKLPLREPTSPDSPFARGLEAFRYRWPIYPKGFTGDGIREQMRQLLWTTKRAG